MARHRTGWIRRQLRFEPTLGLKLGLSLRTYSPRLLTHTLKPESIEEGYRLLIEEKDRALGVVLSWSPASAD